MRQFLRERIANSESAEPINGGHARTGAHRRRGDQRSAHTVTGRVLKFAVVGGTGVVINTSALYVLSRWAVLPILAASALAVELAAISNYLLNDTWTFAIRSPSLGRFAKFNTASLVGLALNVLCVWLLTRLGLYFLEANFIGIAAGFATNYAFSVRWVWGK